MFLSHTDHTEFTEKRTQSLAFTFRKENSAEHVRSARVWGCARYGYWLLFALCSLLFPFLTSCTDDFVTSPVPEPAVVSFSCDIEMVNAQQQQVQQPQLNSPGGYVRVYDRKTLTQQDRVGNAGLLLVQSLEGGQFYAFDLTCPYCYKTSHHISRIVIYDALHAHCPTCASKFGAIFYGSPAPTEGPANAAKALLRQYRAILLGDGKTLVVGK